MLYSVQPTLSENVNQKLQYKYLCVIDFLISLLKKILGYFFFVLQVLKIRSSVPVNFLFIFFSLLYESVKN